MNILFLGLAVVLLLVGGVGLLLGGMAVTSPLGGPEGWGWMLASMAPLGGGLVCLFAAGVLDRLDALARINSKLLATVSGDDEA